MNDMSRSHHAPPIADVYARDGFFCPYDVISEAEAAGILADLEAGEAQLADPQRRAELSMLRSYPARLLPSFDRLIRHPRLIDAVSQILGRDLLVWGSGLFIKEPNSPSFVSWHQDLTYWGLDEVNEVTAWVALSPSDHRERLHALRAGQPPQAARAAPRFVREGQSAYPRSGDRGGGRRGERGGRGAAPGTGVAPSRPSFPRLGSQPHQPAPHRCGDPLHHALDEADIRRTACWSPT